MKKHELTKVEKQQAEMRQYNQYMVEVPQLEPGWDKIEEDGGLVQEHQEQPKQVKAVNPVNTKFVFPEYDSRDAKSLHNFMVSAGEYQQEQEKLRKERCCCGTCKCGR